MKIWNNPFRKILLFSLLLLSFSSAQAEDCLLYTSDAADE